ncbi:hypothetical protein K503DRAFT_867650 [Rhizopogon vinicolor AM-OR11-026]|uniref:DUF6533 domain-containing protein n=1 Tax=Rhizopogon vinicolor AM-OR11-026 TaxID=1314800 RepID=A0A1B7MUR9_9AGAM|nr:hypothetical protein K503DRAFT_867650 [Rhizopogon vinicolor AM-OR11-026]
MTVISNGPIWWPVINSSRVFSYFVVASSTAVIYDWVLTFGQEIELVWRQRCSLMTVLYLSVRYAGILFSVIMILGNVPSVSVIQTDVVSMVFSLVSEWMGVITNAMLEVIIIARLHAMYQQSRQMLIFLVVIFLIVQISCGVITVVVDSHTMTWEEFILSGNHICDNAGGSQLVSITWILGTVWEIIALCLAVWIAVKHFRELRRLGSSTGSIVGDCFTVLIKTHAFYFASFVVVSSLELLGQEVPAINDLNSTASVIYNVILQTFQVVQMFVLGPRLILGVREYHAKLVANSDAASGMTSIAFQERIHISTSNGV